MEAGEEAVEQRSFISSHRVEVEANTRDGGQRKGDPVVVVSEGFSCSCAALGFQKMLIEHPDSVRFHNSFVLRKVGWGLPYVCKGQTDASYQGSSSGGVSVDELDYYSILLQETLMNVFADNLIIIELYPLEGLQLTHNFVLLLLRGRESVD